MATANIASDTDLTKELDSTIESLSQLVQEPDDSEDQTLWYAWHYLQVYSTWGLRLPHTEATLKLKLGISEPGQFDFFEPMKEAYGEIHKACDEFLSEIFPKVINIGTKLLDFAADISEDDGKLFAVLIKMLDKKSALISFKADFFVENVLRKKSIDADKFNQAMELVIEVQPDKVNESLDLFHLLQDDTTEDKEKAQKVIDFIEGADNSITEGILELIGDLQKTTTENKTEAGDVVTLLSGYKAKLTSAKAKVSDTQDKVEADERTSQDTIDRLQGDVNEEGSLANLNQQLKDLRGDYKHYKIVASTTATYFWVGLPGLIAASTVAGIYGKKAVATLKAIHRLEDKKNRDDAELKTALQTNRAQDSANTSLSETETYTARAIEYTTTVQNKWKIVSDSLSYIADKVTAMTKEKDSQTVLKSIDQVKTYAQNSGEKWALLVPPLKALTRDPYITVASNEVSLDEFADEVDKEIAKQAA